MSGHYDEEVPRLLNAMLQAVAKADRKRSKRSLLAQADASTTPAVAQKTVLDLHTSMEMYGLTDSELFCELKRDTRCLMGWSNTTIVLAFRGTASMTNALSDVQVCLNCHRTASLSVWARFLITHICASRSLHGCVLSTDSPLTHVCALDPADSPPQTHLWSSPHRMHVVFRCGGQLIRLPGVITGCSLGPWCMWAS